LGFVIKKGLAAQLITRLPFIDMYSNYLTIYL
jgi:hypothetical protein